MMDGRAGSSMTDIDRCIVTRLKDRSHPKGLLFASNRFALGQTGSILHDGTQYLTYIIYVIQFIAYSTAERSHLAEHKAIEKNATNN